MGKSKGQTGDTRRSNELEEEGLSHCRDAGSNYELTWSRDDTTLLFLNTDIWWLTLL
jgi:hypothetical protein